VTSTKWFNVLDLSSHLSGPIAANLLGWLGGDVIKLERPGLGDGNRAGSVPDQVVPQAHGESIYHIALNIGARSLAVDKRSPAWPAVLETCVRWADVVIVGGRVADAVKRGIDFATLVAINPRLVYVSITGYGENGPLAGVPAHGQNPDAFAGLVPIVDGDDGPRTARGWRPAGTTGAGMSAALGAMAGLARLERTNTAQFVSTSLWHAAMWWGWRDHTTMANAGTTFREFAEFGPRYAVYRTADDKHLLVAPIEQKFWRAFCAATGLDTLSDVGDWSGGALYFGTGPDDPERAAIAEALARQTLAHWCEALAAADIPFAPISSLQDAIESEHVRAERFLATVPYRDGEVSALRAPVALGNLHDEPAGPLRPPPDVGQDTLELIAELGLETAVASRVRADGAIAWVE
jgi:crotonobetainyl-CoA:carnitine CoA-transferase CaiB-like acyl-CoA transferase